MLLFKNIVFLLLLFFAAISCRKKQPHPTDYIPKMAGARHWHGTEKFREYRLDSLGNLYPFDSVIRYIDDSFSIIVVNGSEIFTSICHRSLYYKYANDSAIHFSYVIEHGQGNSSDWDIFYYFLGDKMKFSSFSPSTAPMSYYSTYLETP